MKYLFLFCIIITFPIIAFGQLVNPTIIQQDTDIALHSTDVYYSPFAPPDSTIWRGQLSNEGPLLTNPDGVSTAFPYYGPMVHAARELQDTVLSQWQPCGIPLGPYAVWQRLFQARNKPDGSTSVIIAGGNVGDTVTIGKNEDVDFSASGGVRLESGFHVMPGAFFHAYEEPKWDTAVFSDEFNDSAKFYSQWSVRNGTGGDLGGEGATCPTDTNVRLVTDPDAHDGYAVDIILREDTVDTCNCLGLTQTYLDSCDNVVPAHPDTSKFIFSSGKIQSCPFPYLQKVDTPLVPAYAHAPYGKYEFRDKIPHTLHHTNNWGYGDYGLEFDLNETYSAGSLDSIYPDFNHKLRRGPFSGVFGRLHDTIIFTSPAAHWCLSNNPESLIIDNVPYPVQFIPRHGKDTVYAPGLTQSEWPAYLVNATSTDTFSFYYSIVSNCFADTLTWSVDSTGRIFTAAYHDSSGTLLHFNKWNQPTTVSLTGLNYSGTRDSLKTYACHWKYSLNHPTNYGLLYLDDPMSATDPHSKTEAYGFRATDLYSSPGYPMSPVQFNGNDTTPSSYQYHTFAMEWLPHEVRFLVDSVVVRRLPDRLIPVGSPYYDWITTLPRTLAYFIPAEEAIDPGSITERQAFEHAASVSGWPGFEIVDGKPVAHHLIDYVKIWDVPKDVIVPNYPQH